MNEIAMKLHEDLLRAMHYRGDVTVVLRDKNEGADVNPIEGYIFDYQQHDDPAKARVRMLPKDGSPRITIPLERIERVEFSGRDTASGRSFETWMKKYVEKKLAGERAAIE